MNVTFQCPKCDQAVRTDVALSDPQLECPACHGHWPLPPDAGEGEKLQRCVVCPSTELFVRKDFPQRLGVAIVTVGFIASSVAWYYEYVPLTFGILFATALLDVALYLLVGESLVCYRCGAEYRHVDGIERHTGFNLETHERHRQMKARQPQA